MTVYGKFLIYCAIQVVLEPGDVLHVPPYWFHHVESITPSGRVKPLIFIPSVVLIKSGLVSLASWSEFSAHEPMHELFAAHYETMTWRTYSGKDQIIAVKLYIGKGLDCSVSCCRY